MPSLTQEKAREGLVGVGLRRRLLRVQDQRLRVDTARALENARVVGIPVAEAARLAEVSRSSAYGRYLARGGDDADDSGHGGD